MNTISEDYASSCRLCLSDSRIKIPLFEDEAPNTVDIFLPSKIFTCVSIKVEKNDPFPTWICQCCQTKIEDIYAFRRLCKTSDVKLRTSYHLQSPQTTNALGLMKISEKDLTAPDTQTESVVRIKQEPVDTAEYSCIQPENLVYVKQEENENFENEDSSTEPENNIIFPQDLPQIGESMEKEYMHAEELQSDSGTKDEDYSPPVHFLLDNNNYESVSEPKRQNKIRQPRGLRIQCPSCGCPFTYQAAYDRHMKNCKKKVVQKGKQSKMFTCKVCKAVLESPTALAVHEKFHKRPHKDNTFSCDTCNIQFKQKGELICHQAQYHRAEVNKNVAQQKSFSCSMCGLSFVHKGEYILHKEFYHTASRLASRLPVYKMVSVFNGSSYWETNRTNVVNNN